MSNSPNYKNESVSPTGVMHKILHHFGDWELETKHLTRLEKSIYFDMRTMYLNQGHALTDNLQLLQRRLSCCSDEEKQALDFILEDKFKHCKKSKTFKHKEWDLILKNYRFRHGNAGNESSNAEVTDGNGYSNASNVTDNAQSNAERQAIFKQKRLEMIQALRNHGVKVANNIKMAELKPLYEQHFKGDSNAPVTIGNEYGNEISNAEVTDGNAIGNGDNVKNHAITNNHKPLTNNQEPITTISKPQANVPAGYVLYKTDDDNEYSLFDLEQVYDNVYADFIEQAKVSYVTIVLSEQQYREMFDKMRQWSLEKKDTRTPQKWMNTWLSWVNNNAYKFNNPKTTHAKTATATTSYDSKNVNKAWDSVPKVEYTAEQIAQFRAESDAISKELNLI